MIHRIQTAYRRHMAQRRHRAALAYQSTAFAEYVHAHTQMDMAVKWAERTKKELIILTGEL
jgi:hypothetical protein